MFDALLQFGFIGPGGPELLVIMLVLIMMFGAKDAPRILRKLNEMLTQIRNTADGFKREVMYGDLLKDTPDYSSPEDLYEDEGEDGDEDEGEDENEHDGHEDENEDDGHEDESEDDGLDDYDDDHDDDYDYNQEYADGEFKEMDGALIDGQDDEPAEKKPTDEPVEREGDDAQKN